MVTRTGLIWAARGVVALMFLIPAAVQVSGDAQWNDEFLRLGLGPRGLYAVAVLEVIAAVLVLIPRWTVVGVTLLLCVTAGAFVAQVTVIGNIPHTIVYATILVAALVVFRRAASPVAAG